MRWLASPLALALALALAGCSKSAGKGPDPGPTCGEIVDNIMTVTKQQLTGHGRLELQNRQVMIDTCEGRKLTPTERTCLATAKDLTGIAACTPKPATPPAPAR